MALRELQWASRSGGFTLLEILLALTIVGLVMGLTTVNLRAPSESSLLKAETRKLVAELRAVRAKALSDSRIYAIQATEEGHGYTILPTGELAELPEGFSLVISQGASAAQQGVVSAAPMIRFYPDGSTNGGRIALATENLTRSLDVNWMTGEISLAQEPEAEHAAET